VVSWLIISAKGLDAMVRSMIEDETAGEDINIEEPSFMITR